MLSYTVIVSNEAGDDLDEIAEYIASEYKSLSGHHFVSRILGQIQALSYSAGTYRESPYVMAKLIHPHAKTMNIIHHLPLTFGSIIPIVMVAAIATFAAIQESLTMPTT